MFWNTKSEKRNAAYPTDFGFDWGSWLSGENMVGNNIKDATYYKCLNILGDAIAKLSIDIKQATTDGEIEVNNHDLNDFLTIRPNSSMNMFECMKSLIMLYKHYGMAGLYIQRDRQGNCTGLYPCKINGFTIDNAGLINSSMQNKILVNFTCVGVQGECLDKDIIILRDNSLDGINTKATKNYISDSINTNINAQTYQSNLFANGLTNKAVVQYASDIKDEKEIAKTQTKFNNLFSATGRIFTVPVGFTVTPLNLNLADSQFAELKLQGKQDISSALGIPFNLLQNGNLTEDETLAFLSNAIQPILTCLEMEMDYKLLGSIERKQGYKIRFNINSMLRVSPEKQMKIITDYVKMGIYSLEYARNVLGINIGADETVVFPSGQVLLKDLISGKVSYLNNSVAKGGEDDGEGDKANNN